MCDGGTSVGGRGSWDEEKCFHIVMKSTNTWRSATNLWLRGAAFLDDNSDRAAGTSSSKTTSAQNTEKIYTLFTKHPFNHCIGHRNTWNHLI